MERDERTTRTRKINRVRRLLGDEQIIKILRRIGETTAIELFLRAVDQGATLDDLFDERMDYGFEMDVHREREGTYKISFSCLPPCGGSLPCGDGGTWLVRLSRAGQIEDVECKETWMT